MDLITLGQKLKENPITYISEYNNELKTFEALLSLPNPPIKQIKPLISFVVTCANIDPERTLKILITALNQIKHPKTRSAMLNGMILIRQKGIITSKMLVNFILMNSNSPKEYMKGCKEFLDVECWETVKEWYNKGTDKQRIFCYYLVLMLYPMAKSGDKSDSTTTVCIKSGIESIICDGFLGDSKIARNCMLYFLNKADVDEDIKSFENGAECAKILFKELQEQNFEREIKLMKLRVFLRFKRWFKVRQSATNLIIRMLDVEKADIKEVLDCLIASTERGDVMTVLGVLSDDFVTESREDDVICYGMNVMREVYYKIANIDKFSESADDESIDEFSESIDEVENESINDESANESKESNEADEFTKEVKEQILKYIEPFKGNKNRSISCAYRMLMKALLHRESVNVESTYVNKAKTKEERIEKTKKTREERVREKKAEHYQNRKSKRTKAKKNRLLTPKKRRNVRS